MVEASKALRVLHVEDIEDDTILVAHALERGGWQPQCRRVDTAAAMRAALQGETWDLVISDFGLPAFNAPSALSVLQEFNVDVPFIIVSGSITEEAAVAAMKAGAHDYVTKSHLNRLAPAVRRELREAESRAERRRAEDLRHQAEARFRTLVDSLDGIVFTLNDQLRLDTVFGRGLGHGRLDELRYLGKRLEDLLGAAGTPDAATCARSLAGESVVHEWAQDDPLGTQHLQLSLAPIQMDDGVIGGLVGLVRDITEQKKVQAHLLQSDRLASIGALAASVAHEINNPLASLMANLESVSAELQAMAREPGTTAFAPRLLQAQETLSDMREAAGRVRQVARDLHVVSRASEERSTPVDVRQVLEASIRMAWHEIRHRARLVRDFHPVLPVLASDARLGQVFLNLLVNAAQAISPGDARGNEIRVSLRARDARHVVIEISDTGHGMAADVKQRLFTPFFTTKPEGAGMGIGLSICQRIVAGIGGFIAVESTVGEGSVFRVVLPTTAQVPAAEAKPEPHARPATRRARVLVVDDEPMVQRAVQRTLAAEHDVVAVSSGREALRLVEGGQRFDVIFCDLMMPEMTGLELYAALTAEAPAQAAQMVFLTGGVTSEGMRAFLEGVANLTIEKPFDPRMLFDIVAERVGTRP